MNFTASVKQELASLPPGKACCMTAELRALSMCLASLTLMGQGKLQMKYQSHSPSVAKRVLILLKKRYAVSAVPGFSTVSRFGGRRVYELRLSGEDSQRMLAVAGTVSAGGGVRLSFTPGRVIRRICCRRAWIRGAFLGCGSITQPQRGYRAEFALERPQAAEYLMKLLELNGVKAARVERRGSQVVYVRDGDSVVTLLSLMGATRATLDTENLRAAATLKRDLNRVANCDQANIQKQLSAAQRQVAVVTAISLQQGLGSLPKELEALARLRLAHPDAGMKELAEMLRPPITKSGVQHRLRRLMDIAEALPGIPTEGM